MLGKIYVLFYLFKGDMGFILFTMHLKQLDINIIYIRIVCKIWRILLNRANSLYLLGKIDKLIAISGKGNKRQCLSQIYLF